MEASQAIIFAQSFNNGPQFFPAARMLGITVAGATFHTDKVLPPSGMILTTILDRAERRFDKWRPKVRAAASCSLTRDTEEVKVTVVSTDKDLEPIYFPAKDLFRRFGKVLIKLLTKIEFPKNKASSWPLIFLQSAANGCCYRGEDLPHSQWQWPKDTWFQEQRRRQLIAIALSAEQFGAVP